MGQPICKDCRFFVQSRRGLHLAWCGSPRAAKTDRVRGDVYPRLDGLLDLAKVKETTDKCDAGGWFAAIPRPRWRFWS